MALVGEMQYLTIGGNTYSIPVGGSTVQVERNLTSGTKSATITVDGTSYDLYSPTPNAGTVTSVRVQATSPVQSSTSTAQSSSLNTTISLANGYGDTKNPYGAKTKNYVLAGPTTGNNAAPTFRALVASDIPDLSGTYLTSYTETDPVFGASAAAGITSTDITNWNNKADIYDITTGVGDSSNGSAFRIRLGNYYGNYEYTNFMVFVNKSQGVNNKVRISTTTNGNQLEISKSRITIDGQTDPTNINPGLYYGTLSDWSNSATLTLTSAPKMTDIPTIPTNISSFTNDAGYITSYTETDPVFSASAAAGITSSDISNWNAKTSNTGTVTSVTISNATNGGLTISGSPISTSGTITVGHSNVLTSAQTTEAVYPIKIDKNGHISSYGSAVTIPTVPSNIVNTITTTAGTHTAITSQKGNVSFNVPTKTSHLTNDSGFITTDSDEKVKQTPLNGENAYHGLLFSNGFGSSENTNTVYTTDKIQWNDTSNALALVIYNDDNTKNASIKYNTLWLANSSNSYKGRLYTSTLSSTRTYYLPDNNGTIALTSNIPDVSGKIDTAGSGLSKSGTTLNHASTITAATVGTSSATSGISIDVPYITYNDTGHITDSGTHTHTIPMVTTSSSGLMSKEDKIILDAINDYIISQGTSSSWKYRKWSSGKIEAWYTGELSASTTTATGSIYRSTYSLSIPAAIGFASAPKMIMSIDQNAATVFGVNGRASSKTAISGYIFRSGQSTDTYTLNVSIYAWTS